jgi:formylglycine-generating enzyme required for sulfatase activity
MNIRRLTTLLMLCGTVLAVYAQVGQNIDTNIAVTDQVDANTFAVIISNEHYEEAEDVPFSINDGSTFKRYCEQTLGIPERNIRFEKDATINKMKLSLNWLERQMQMKKGEARAFFYYSGHGLPDDASKKAYLLPVDGSSTDLTTGFSTEELYKRLGSMSSKATIVLLDACFSGTQRDGSMINKARGVAIKPKDTPVEGNMVVFSAAQGTETALPLNSKEHGAFTYYLLEKLHDTKGNVTLGDLSDYVIEKVANNQENNKPQTPTVNSSTQGWRNWKFANQEAAKYVNMPKETYTAKQTSAKSSTTVSTTANAPISSSALDVSAGGAFSLAGVIVDLVRIDKGTFMMGAKEMGNSYSTFSMNMPAHRVTLKSFVIGKTEVTQELWEAVMGSNPSANKGPKLPVENVSWDDCQTFIKKLNQMCGTKFRLPTEAEWEYAADGGNDIMSNTFSGTTHYEAVAHKGITTAECGSKKSSTIGLMDMSGNVAEWCQDYYGRYQSGSQTNPKGPSNGLQRVVRGGSYEDNPQMMRNCQRGHMKQGEASPTVGLRLVHDVNE